MQPDREGNHIGETYNRPIDDDQSDQGNTHCIDEVAEENKHDYVDVLMQPHFVLYLDIEQIEKFYSIYY